MEIRSFYINPDGKIERDLSSERLREARIDITGLLWIDILDPNHEVGPFLLHDMGFHPLAVDDCLSSSHQPAKVDDYGSHMYMIVHGIDYSSTEEFIETARLSMFIAEGTVVTVHRVPLISIETVIDRVERDERLLERPSSLFSYTILDSLHDKILPALDHLAEVGAELEEVSIETPRKQVLHNILQLKRSAVRIHRTMAPQIRVFSRLSRNEFPLISAESSVYFRDLQDQIIQLDVINTGVRDSADNALATYLSSIGIRQNETMRVLAIVAAIFLPLSLIAGIYGMNFVNMPELENRWGYFAVLGAMATIGLGTFYWVFIRHMGWHLRGQHIVKSMKPTVEKMERMTNPISTVRGMTEAVTDSIAKTVASTVSDRFRDPLTGNNKRDNDNETGA